MNGHKTDREQNRTSSKRRSHQSIYRVRVTLQAQIEKAEEGRNAKGA